jgi:hypothetical protein
MKTWRWKQYPVNVFQIISWGGWRKLKARWMARMLKGVEQLMGRVAGRRRSQQVRKAKWVRWARSCGKGTQRRNALRSSLYKRLSLV